MKKHRLCECERCPLKDAEYVPSEGHFGAKFMVLGDYPNLDDVREKRPFLGVDNNRLTQELYQAGVQRGEVYWANVIGCRPPERLERILAGVRKENRKVIKENRVRRKEGKDLLVPMLTPQKACAGRLAHELNHFTKIVPCGTYAVKSIFSDSISIMDVRGAPSELNNNGQTIKVLPTFHPSFVGNAMRWYSTFQSDIQRATKWFRGDPLSWSPPEILYHPTPAQLKEFLSQPESCWAYDVETDGIECLTANLRCVAIGSPNRVVVVGYLSVNGTSRFYDPGTEVQITQVLKEFFEDESILKSGHNAGYYDRIVMQEQLGIAVEPCLDTMMLHRLVASELPHSLGFCGSIYTEAPSWKTDRNGKKKAYGSETDHELHEYCAYDVAITAAILPPLWHETKQRNQARLVASDHQIQSICADMHTVGMYVDQKKRLEYERQFLREIQSRRQRIREFAGSDSFNPASVKQLRTMIYEDWRLDPPVERKYLLTKAGDPSTSDHVMRSLLTLKGLTPHQRSLITEIRHYRKVQKLLGTYVTKLRYNTEEAWGGWDDEDSWLEKEWREKYGIVKLGIVDPQTGRCYPGYNAHVTNSGRLSSSKPINAQNFPSKLRSMIVAAPGHIFIGADADQLELRIAASRWQSQQYLEAFKRGLDPHSSVTAHTVFGDLFEKAALKCGVGGYPWKTGTEFTGAAKKLRKLSKSIQYASQYYATVPTVHRLITQTEIENDDGTTTLPYIGMELKEVRLMHEKWCEGAKFDYGWNQEIQTWKSRGFLEEPILGRRRDFLDGENPNELVNFPIQSSAASLMNLALIELHQRIPLNKWGKGTGIINQCHDSIVVEAPIGEANWVKEQLEECMNWTHPAFPQMRFTASADIHHRWSNV